MVTTLASSSEENIGPSGAILLAPVRAPVAAQGCHPSAAASEDNPSAELQFARLQLPTAASFHVEEETSTPSEVRSFARVRATRS